MRERIVEIAENGRFLSCRDGFLLVSEKGEELGRVPLDDVLGVIATAPGVSFSRSLVDSLATRGAAFVLCGKNFTPAAWLVPMTGHHSQGERLRAQAEASVPLRKRSWQALVQAKLKWQAATLAAAGVPPAPLLSLADKVRSGDPNNIEAQGARRYWKLLFGKSFQRDTEAAGLNALLNYGYAVLRAAAARAVAGAGLHPGLGVFHSSHKNPMPLADDLMEPFRPAIDAMVRIGMVGAGCEEGVTPEAKRRLVKTLFLDIDTNRGITPLMTCIHRLASSLAELFLEEREELEIAPAPAGDLLKQRLLAESGNEDTDGIPADVDDGDV
jgi:CRISPR-associated protein Cas1